MIIKYILGLLSPKLLARINFRKSVGWDLDFDNVRDINEKVQWLKFYSDTTEWEVWADKYRVRDYVAKCGLSSILVDLYAVFDNSKEFSIDSLPQSFIIKANNGCGGNFVVKDKSRLDMLELRSVLNEWSKERFGVLTAEPHYLKIPFKIIVEELLENEFSFSNSMVDFKVYCFNGEPEYICVCYDRDCITKKSKMSLFDKDWVCCNKYLINRSGAIDDIERPKSLDKMKEACRKLSKGIPMVRIDFYEYKGNPYFGEMTMTNAGGYDTDYTLEFRRLLGDLIILPKK